VRSVVLAPDDDGYDDASSGGSGDGGNRAERLSNTTTVSPGTQQFIERVRLVYTAAPV
jgi:hypothetical protein